MVQGELLLRHVHFRLFCAFIGARQPLFLAVFGCGGKSVPACPVFHVTTITHRQDAVYPVTIVGIPADGRFLHWRRERETVPAGLQAEFPQDRGHRAAGGRRVPQPRVRQHQENLSDAGLQKSLRTATRHGLWGMGQMMFTKYIVVVDADVNVHNTSEVLFHLTANTDPQRDSIFTKGPSDVLDHATSEIASGSKLGIDATKKIPGEGFKRAWPPLIKMSDEVRRKIDGLLEK